MVEIDFKEVASLIAYADGADPLDVSDAVGRYRGGGYRGSITCNGHTEHFISVREPRGGLWSPAQPQVYGLKNGDNDVKVDITLVDGTRLSRSYTIAANTVTLTGQGFGHGVGMCQFGAQHMAFTGNPHDKILGFYYPGARIKQAY